MPPLTLRRVISALLVTGILAPAVDALTLRVDFNSGASTQSGWQSLAASDSALGDSWSKNFGGGIAIDADPVGGVSLDSRDRGGNNGGGAESDMWRDFLFANGSFSTAPGSGLSLAITGLAPNSTYPITVWAFDDGSNGNRAADWSGGGGGPVRLTFPNSPAPGSLGDYSITFDALTDGSGAVTLTGIVSATSPNTSHNVFINGLELGDPVSTDGQTDLALSNATVAKSAPIGSLVGTLSTTDPTPGDTFTYTLVGGAGGDHNSQFAIEGDRLETDRDLSALTGPLSVRIRTTDAEGDFFEQVFRIELLNDSDNDGLDDTWELSYFPDLETATGAGNNDGDSLTNAEEQAAGTHPTLADTDGDGLDDDDEINTYGSDPTLVDTDGDGLDDGEEVSPANGHVTDPADPDSDDDGFNDALEIAEGTDPNNGGDFPNTLLPLRLNEILARNDTDIDDGFGNKEDWIEIYNPNTVAVNLDGYFLTDNAGTPTKWNFPNVSIAAGGYRLVFASGKDLVDPGGNPHSNFQLSADGEYLAIIRPDGGTVDDSFSPIFPEQFTDVSYGPPGSGGAPVFYQNSTPGAVNNSTAYPGVVKDTNFSIDRGFYDTPFQVAITSATPTATIRYTTDGSWPMSTNGTIYSAPVDITTTTTLRAIAYQSGWLSTNVDSHTYIFVDDVAVQPSNPPGWPATWGNHDGLNVPSDYQMDPRVVNNTNGLGEYTVEESLLDIPTMSVAMNPDDFISDATGIYANPQNRTEMLCSIEYIRPDGVPGFQEDCKIETHGNASRRVLRMQKHSLRLTFTSEVGTPKLRYPLFPDSPVEEFNKLVLRACFTDSWALTQWGGSNRYRPNDSMYMRDVWMKNSLKAMGQPSSHGNFVHLYVNGLYFGLHNLTERLEDDFFADHLGGAKEDYQINVDLSTSPPRWSSMMSVLNGSIADNATYETAKQYIDVENFADYMLLHFYGESEDWPHHNGYAAANPVSGDGRFRFFCWDQEIALDNFSWNRYSATSGAGAPFQRLRLNEEFRLLFADRAQKHMFNGGALSLEASTGRFLDICAEIDKAIMAESARWGDVQATTPYAFTPGSTTNPFGDFYPPTVNNPIYFTREQHWLVERDHVVNTHIPIIHSTSDPRGLINELRSNNLYPSIDAPEFSQHGGIVPIGHTLGIEAAVGTIYYTLDGSDPREVGGGINPDAGSLAGGSILDTFIDFEATGWRYLDTGVAQSDSEVVVGNASYGTGDWKHPDYDDSAWGTGQAMLGYGTIGSGGDTVTINTTVGPASTPRYPTTYFRKEFTVTGASDYTELSTSIIRDDGAIVYLNGKELGRSNLTAGNKTYDSLASSASPEQAVVALGSFALSPGDLIEGANVIAVEVHQQGTNSSDLGIDLQVKATKPNPGASGVTLNQTGTVKARALNNGEWSALTSAEFIVGIPASASNLVVSELMYNPPGAAETGEFIELVNISTSDTIEMANVEFAAGISYTFAAGQQLALGARIVLSPTDYSGNLNNDGETITLLDSSGGEIESFTYGDSAPWPEAPDDGGYSLVRIAPELKLDPDLPTSWRSSTASGGNPGGSDAVAYAGGDLLAHALGPEQSVSAGINGAGDVAAIEYSRNLAADDVTYTVYVSTDLQTWSTGPGFTTATSESPPRPDGTTDVTVSSLLPANSEPRQFMQLVVELR